MFVKVSMKGQGRHPIFLEMIGPLTPKTDLLYGWDVDAAGEREGSKHIIPRELASDILVMRKHVGTGKLEAIVG
jgi:hypothetical protein